MSIRDLIEIVSKQGVLRESDGEAPPGGKTTWRLIPFGALPRKKRYCEADTIDQAAMILAARLRPLWTITGCKKTERSHGKFSLFTVSYTRKSGSHLNERNDEITVMDATRELRDASGDFDL